MRQGKMSPYGRRHFSWCWEGVDNLAWMAYIEGAPLVIRGFTFPILKLKQSYEYDVD